MNETGDSKRADFILQLHLILVGLGFGFSIQNLISDAVSLSSIVRFITVIILLVLWLQGQIAYGLSETYDVPSKWFTRVLENYVEVTSIIILMVVTMVQNKVPIFYFIVFLSYFFDLILELFYVRRLKPVMNNYRREYEVALSWLYIDIIASFLFLVFIWLRMTWQAYNDLYTSISFLTVVLVLTFWDYSYNRDFYLGLPRKISPQR